MPTVVRNLVVHALRSLNAIQLLISADLERLIVYVNSWHISNRVLSPTSVAESARIRLTLFKRPRAQLREVFLNARILVMVHQFLRGRHRFPSAPNVLF